jgi:hypothetical protein
MSEMSERERRLELISNHIAQARELIHKQEKLIKTRISKGLNTEQEQKLLGLMRATLGQIENLQSQIFNDMIRGQPGASTTSDKSAFSGLHVIGSRHVPNDRRE